MKRKHLAVRCAVLAAGLFFMALGVSVSVRADLGVTPISCVPYVYSLVTPFTLGDLTIFMNAVFMLLQMCILRRKYKPMQLIQFPAVVILGYCIDFTMRLVSGIAPATYAGQIAWLLLSTLLIALGVFLVVKADITFIPGDGLIAAIAFTYKTNFGKTKMCFDSSMVVIGIVSSLALLHALAGIREGTIIAALLVGYAIQLYDRTLTRIVTALGHRPAD